MRKLTLFDDLSRRRVMAVASVLILAFVVRLLTANFVASHLHDTAWFQSGTYAVSEKQALKILDGSESFFWINDSTRTDLIIYPPGTRVWIAAIYWLTGERSPLSVIRVQVVFDTLSILLIIGIGVTAFGWRAGLIGGTVAALSPLLALFGVLPPASDATTSWFVLGAVWALLLSFRRQSIPFAIAAGVLLGLACWIRVNPLLLLLLWSISVFFLLKASIAKRAGLALSLALSTILVIGPVVIRNLVVFYPEIAPTGLGVGWNLLAGIGETERGPEFNVPCCDEKMVEQDRIARGLSADAPLELHYPDGIRRDRERGHRAIAIIKAHPVWYAGVVTRRFFSHLKLAGKPVPSMGTAGINVTPSKTLPTRLQTPPLSIAVTILGVVQSIQRYLMIPLVLVGIVIAFQRDFRISALLMSTILYYLATLSVAHSELRYGLPMQALLCVFAGVGIASLVGQWRSVRSGRVVDKITG